jgi:hypothetical protein
MRYGKYPYNKCSLLNALVITGKGKPGRKSIPASGISLLIHNIKFDCMKILFPLVFLFASMISFAQPSPSIRDLKSGKVNPDISYVYSLPFQKGKKYLLIQAYMSKMSHKGEIAVDFKMKKGTKVCAARAGVVIAMREDSRKGGLKPEMLSEGISLSYSMPMAAVRIIGI